MVVRPRLLQVRGEGLGNPARRLLVLRTGRVRAGEFGVPRLGELGSMQLPRRGEHLGRPLHVGFPQQSQVEQPFAGVVDDIEMEPPAA